MSRAEYFLILFIFPSKDESTENMLANITLEAEIWKTASTVLRKSQIVIYDKTLNYFILFSKLTIAQISSYNKIRATLTKEQ